MTRNTGFIFFGLACLVIGAAGYWIYQEHNRSGVELSVGGSSVIIETR